LEQSYLAIPVNREESDLGMGNDRQ
jgi:hypothetical protein